MLNYTTYVASLVNLMPVDSASDPNFVAVLPNIIDDAEQRLYRELDLLNTNTTQTGTFTTGQRTFDLPSANGTVVVVNRINVWTPLASSSANATRNPLLPIGNDALDALWPSATGSSVPQYFGMVTQTTILVGPWPDQAYTVEVTGTVRPAAISTTNATTLLSVYFPDLFIAASMVFASGYMKNFGAQMDDPKMAVSWESHLQTLLQSAQTEEQRKRFNMAGWSSKQPSPSATPERT